MSFHIIVYKIDFKIWHNDEKRHLPLSHTPRARTFKATPQLLYATKALPKFNIHRVKKPFFSHVYIKPSVIWRNNINNHLVILGKRTDAFVMSPKKMLCRKSVIISGCGMFLFLWLAINVPQAVLTHETETKYL